MLPISLSLRRISFAVLLFRTVICQGQSLSDTQMLHCNDFNWSVAIPKGFEKVPDTLLTKLQNKGTALIEHTYGKKIIVYGTLKANLPNARFDSSYSREVIGGKEFNLFTLVAYINPQVTVHVLMYGRLFEKKELCLNIMYADPAKGKTLLEAWRGSSFGD
jgi:hypothetical protein